MLTHSTNKSSNKSGERYRNYILKREKEKRNNELKLLDAANSMIPSIKRGTDLSQLSLMEKMKLLKERKR